MSISEEQSEDVFNARKKYLSFSMCAVRIYVCVCLWVCMNIYVCMYMYVCGTCVGGEKKIKRETIHSM